MSDTTDSKPATIKGVYEFFKSTYATLAAFSKDWKELSEKDQNELKVGIGADGAGTMTY